MNANTMVDINKIYCRNMTLKPALYKKYRITNCPTQINKAAIEFSFSLPEASIGV